EKTFKDALDVNKRHPGALIGMARVVMETNNYYAEARRYLDRAEKVFPASPELKLARAKLAIFDGDWSRALELTDAILADRPKHLEAMAYRAAVYYLKDDRESYEQVKQKALELRPDYAGLLTTVAEFAVLVHRYKEGVTLNRQALELRNDDPKALIGLGIGLSRLGRIGEARAKLQKAFELDPYNVRAYNMVQFFDKTMPKYRVFRHDDFLLRAKDSQAPVIDQLVSPLVSESLGVYEDKYGFEPADELSIEVYPDPKEFGVRTVGLPNISPHGICFGSVVATRSPSDGNFNWRQVVWHEMAHVFHIQEANYRVPRWFTEGLAEYETNVKDAAWVRHHERRIAAALRDGEIPSIVDLNRGFSQAKSYRDILRAYHLSSLVIHFIVDRWDFGSVNAMLEAFREKLRTQRVIEDVLEVDVATFDEQFRAWLGERLAGFDNQLLIDTRRFAPPAKLKASVPPSGRDGWYHARMAVGKLRKGDAEQALASMKRALEIGSTDPQVQYVAAAFYASRGRAKTARKHVLKVLEQGRDDYRLRVRLGRLARVLEDLEAAHIHLQAAVQLYPDGSGAWKQLMKVAETTGDGALLRRATRRLFELDQTSAEAAKRYTELAIAEERWSDAAEGVRRWYAIQPFEPKVHRTDVKVSLIRDRPEEAMEAYKLLAKLRPSQKSEIWRKAAERFRKTGYADYAHRASERAGVGSRK
ncbi:MAG: peptidase MA family metallohydrolase, partial [Bradymonadaceae bacterium]